MKFAIFHHNINHIPTINPNIYLPGNIKNLQLLESLLHPKQKQSTPSTKTSFLYLLKTVIFMHKQRTSTPDRLNFSLTNRLVSRPDFYRQIFLVFNAKRFLPARSARRFSPAVSAARRAKRARNRRPRAGLGRSSR